MIAAALIAPVFLGIAALFVSRKRMWVRALLAAPALLIGCSFTWAVAKDGPGYMGVVALVYGPLLFLLGLAALWSRRLGRGSAD